MNATLFYSISAISISVMGLAQGGDQIKDFWFNGAEINRYALTQARYGKLHNGHAEFIFVTEPFLIEKQVKQESGSGISTPVLKLNALRTFNTGIYSYRTMTSVFCPIDQKKFPGALKSNTSAQDWCGQAFVQFNRKENGWSMESRSYFQNEGDSNTNLPDAMLEDALWVQLRLSPEALPVGEIKLIPGAVFSRFRHIPAKPEIATASLKQENDQFIYRVHYASLGRTLTIHADRIFPHIIRQWSEEFASSKVTTTAKLTHRIMNSPYWTQNTPDDAHLRKNLGLSPEAK